MAGFTSVLLIVLPTSNKGLCKIFTEWLNVNKKQVWYTWINKEIGWDHDQRARGLFQCCKQGQTAPADKRKGDLFRVLFWVTIVPWTVRVTEWVGLPRALLVIFSYSKFWVRDTIKILVRKVPGFRIWLW